MGAMTTDNRTNEPTPEQIEAAAQAVREVDARAGLIADVDLPMYRARAALAAAAGAAPQAESVPTSKYISPHLPGMIRNLWKSDPSENSVRTALKLAGDLIQELIDLRAAPVQPSSTVDVAALAEVIESSAAEWGDSARVNNVLAQYIARAVAEYLT